jgi:hypothetical protein
MPVHVTPRTTTLPGGVTEKIDTFGNDTPYVTTTDASGVKTFRFATEDEIAAASPVRPSPPIWRNLGTALLAMVTILVHGAAVVSLGLALGIWIRGRAPAIAGSVCVFLGVTIAWPIYCVFVASPGFPWALALASLPVSLGGLLVYFRTDGVNGEIVAWALLWNAFFIVLSALVVKLTLVTIDRRCGVQPTKPHHREFAHTAETPLSAR